MWISSIKNNFPSRNPNSYLVSTRINPCSRAISVPRWNSARVTRSSSLYNSGETMLRFRMSSLLMSSSWPSSALSPV